MKARGAVVATLLGVMLMSALYPLRQYMSQDSHVAALVKQERVLRSTIAELRREQELLLSDDEIERVAREELGMVRPGEVAFAVVPGAAQARARAAAPASANLDDRLRNAPWYERWWDTMFNSLRGMR
jgi:cell division protein FtsB